MSEPLPRRRVLLIGFFASAAPPRFRVRGPLSNCRSSRPPSLWRTVNRQLLSSYSLRRTSLCNAPHQRETLQFAKRELGKGRCQHCPVDPVSIFSGTRLRRLLSLRRPPRCSSRWGAARRVPCCLGYAACPRAPSPGVTPSIQRVTNYISVDVEGVSDCSLGRGMILRWRRGSLSAPWFMTWRSRARLGSKQFTHNAEPCSTKGLERSFTPTVSAGARRSGSRTSQGVRRRPAFGERSSRGALQTREPWPALIKLGQGLSPVLNTPRHGLEGCSRRPRGRLSRTASQTY
jgi:hypothetical protein